MNINMKISSRGILAVKDYSDDEEPWAVCYIPQGTETGFYVGMTLSSEEVNKWTPVTIRMRIGEK